MGHSWRLTAFANALLFLFASSSIAMPPDEAKRVAELIRNLGSEQFAEREQASKQLEAIGAPALVHLRQMSQNQDLEVLRRADELIRRIEKRIESTRLLAPRRVNLCYKSVPILEALADLSKQSQIKFDLEGDKAGWSTRTITLDTGETTYWEALESFCKKAGLVEKLVDPTPNRLPGGKSYLDKVLETPINYKADRNEQAQVVTLVPGTLPQLPTCQVGALRIRAMFPNPVPGWGRTPGVNEVTLFLEVTPEPSLDWLGVLEVRLEKAVDEHAQQHTQVTDLHHASTTSGSEIIQGNGKLRIILNQLDNNPATAFVQQPVLRLHLAGKPSRILKELRGTLFGQLITPMDTLVTIPDILTAGGKSFRFPDETPFKVTEVVRTKEKHLKIRTEWEMATIGDPVNLLINNQRRFNQAVLWQADGRYSGNPFAHIHLEDRSGKSIEPQVNTADVLRFDGKTATYAANLLFHADAGVAEPSLLVLRGRRVALVEVPFVLRDVPLP